MLPPVDIGGRVRSVRPFWRVRLLETRSLLQPYSSGMTMNRPVALALLKLRQWFSNLRQIRLKVGWYRNNRAKVAPKITAIRPVSSPSLEIVLANFKSKTNLRLAHHISNPWKTLDEAKTFYKLVIYTTYFSYSLSRQIAMMPNDVCFGS